MNLPLFPLSYAQLSGFLGRRRTGQGDGSPSHHREGSTKSLGGRRAIPGSRELKSSRTVSLGGAWLEGAGVLGRRALLSGFGGGRQDDSCPGRDLPASAPFSQPLEVRSSGDLLL